jgi:hypothetical protein
MSPQEQDQQVRLHLEHLHPGGGHRYHQAAALQGRFQEVPQAIHPDPLQAVAEENRKLGLIGSLN